MRCNVDLLKIIQVGLTLADEEGNYPQDVTTWQFNFLFSVKYVKPLGRLQTILTSMVQRRYVRARIDRTITEVWDRLPTTRGNRNLTERFCRTHDHIRISVST